MIELTFEAWIRIADQPAAVTLACRVLVIVLTR
jgi:hypothetical protein